MATSPYDLYNQNPQATMVQTPIFQDPNQSSLYDLGSTLKQPNTGKGSMLSGVDGKSALAIAKGLKDWYDSKKNQGTGFSMPNITSMTNAITPDFLNNSYTQPVANTYNPSVVNAITPDAMKSAYAPTNAEMQPGFKPGMFSSSPSTFGGR